MINQSVSVIDFNIACETPAMQEWIFSFLESFVELIVISCYLIQRYVALPLAEHKVI
jgi:hypothetical protein